MESRDFGSLSASVADLVPSFRCIGGESPDLRGTNCKATRKKRKETHMGVPHFETGPDITSSALGSKGAFLWPNWRTTSAGLRWLSRSEEPMCRPKAESAPMHAAVPGSVFRVASRERCKGPKANSFPNARPASFPSSQRKPARGGCSNFGTRAGRSASSAFFQAVFPGMNSVSPGCGYGVRRADCFELRSDNWLPRGLPFLRTASFPQHCGSYGPPFESESSIISNTSGPIFLGLLPAPQPGCNPPDGDSGSESSFFLLDKFSFYRGPTKWGTWSLYDPYKNGVITQKGGHHPTWVMAPFSRGCGDSRCGTPAT